MHDLLASGDCFHHGQGLAVSLSASSCPASGDQISQDLDPASLSFPAAHVHRQRLMRMHQHSLVSDCVHGLLFGKQPLETTQVQLQSQLLAAWFPQGQIQTTLNSAPQNRGPQV